MVSVIFCISGISRISRISRIFGICRISRVCRICLICVIFHFYHLHDSIIYNVEFNYTKKIWKFNNRKMRVEIILICYVIYLTGTNYFLFKWFFTFKIYFVTHYLTLKYNRNGEYLDQEVLK